jgi:hypothetical protein
LLAFRVLETPPPNLVAGVKWLLGTYTGRFNRRHRLAGHKIRGEHAFGCGLAAPWTGIAQTCEHFIHDGFVLTLPVAAWL